MDLPELVADKIGVPAEAFRLVLTLLAGYPIAAAYHKYVVDVPAKACHHLYFALCGLGLCYFNYGTDTYHSLLAVSTTYALVSLLRGSPILMLSANFIFHMTYLLLGYYYTASNGYDILWTMPQCILTLRMIGFGFDVADGLKTEDKLSKDQKETVLREKPSYLELLAYAYFPSSFLIGPQFPYRRYQSFTNGEFREHKGNVEAGLKRLSAGVLYLTVCQVGLYYLPDDYFLSTEFVDESFLKRIYFLGFWAKFTLYKYIACWLLCEGALMCIGFTYNGKDALGIPDWFGCSNVKLIHLETGTSMQDYVLSFNVNTNKWVAHYIFKRLKFLNNRNISYGATLTFLAIWHGYHSGYYMTFLLEYMIVSVEKQIESVYTKHVLPKYGEALKGSKAYTILYFFFLKSYNIVVMGWSLTAFVFLKYDRWIAVFSAVNYFGFLYLLIWTIFYHGHRYYLSTIAKERRDTAPKQATD